VLWKTRTPVVGVVPSMSIGVFLMQIPALPTREMKLL